jgi:subtilase family serine protease
MSAHSWSKYWEWFAPVIIIVIIVCIYFIQTWQPCLPDLLVKDHTTENVGANYNVHVTVINEGCAASGECLVYCNAISMTPPVGENEIRAQQSWILEELIPGQTATHTFSFNAQMLGNQTVGLIEILVDAKVMVRESNEDNNIAWWAF